MGKGVALEFRKRFPAMFEDYVARCERGEVRLGQPYLYRDSSGVRIVNFPTKNHWRSPARLTDIAHGLDYFSRTRRNGKSAVSRSLRSVAATVAWNGRKWAR